MIKSYNIFLKCGGIVNRALFLSIILITVVFQNLNAQDKNENHLNQTSNVAFENSNLSFISTPNEDAVNFDGKFVIKDGIVEGVKSFNLIMPLANTNNFFADNSSSDFLSFKLTHVMVLNNMKLIHIIGYLNVGGVIKRTELDFSYIVNEDQSLSLFATKKIKLSDYNTESKYSALTIKNNNELDLQLTLLLENKNQKLIAAN